MGTAIPGGSVRVKKGRAVGRALHVLAAASLFAAAACTTEFPSPAADPDAGEADARALDAAGLDARAADAQVDGAPADAGPPAPDGAERDAVPVPDLQLPDAAVPDAACARRGPETCDGTDEDCDGQIDEDRVCGDYVEAHCRVHLGWAAGGDVPRNREPSFGPCPDRPTPVPGNLDSLSCTATTGEPVFRLIDLVGRVDETDVFAVAFTCDGGPDATLDRWLARNCRAMIGHAAGQNVNGSRDDWGPCPAAEGERDGFRCASTSGDGLWHQVRLPARLDNDDELAVALRCDDPEQAARAVRVRQSVDVFLGWAQADPASFEGLRIADGGSAFGACPAVSRVASGAARCVASGGDGRFHVFPLSDVGPGHRQVLAVGLFSLTAP